MSSKRTFECTFTSIAIDDQRLWKCPSKRLVDVLHNRKRYMPIDDRPHQDREENCRRIRPTGIVNKRELIDDLRKQIDIRTDFFTAWILRDRQ